MATVITDIAIEDPRLPEVLDVLGRAHRFYFREGMTITAYHFSVTL